jgi:uncharacterized membrane protein (DUF2068 family)
MRQFFGHGRWGFWIIGAYKLAKAVVILTAGLILVRKPGSEIAEGLVHLAARARIDPDNRILNLIVSRLTGADRRHLEAIGAGAILYSLLYTAQGVGLLLQRRWGAYLVIVTTGFLVPFECYEVLQKASMARITVLAVNLAIVAYLIAKLKEWPPPQENRSRKELTDLRPRE